MLGDFDGDGLTDFAIWRPSEGNWWIRPNVSSTAPYFQQFGLDGDIPVPGDYDGDKRTDYAIWRPSEGTWYVLPSNTSAGSFTQPWGLPGDIPIAGDFDNDGFTDFGVFAPSEANLYVLLNDTATSYVQQFGVMGSIPIYNQPPLTPSIGPAVRKTPENRSARRKPVVTRTSAQRTLAMVGNRRVPISRNQ